MIQGTNIIKAITMGSNIVQQNDINWSYLILGNEARTHINVNINMQVFTANIIPSVKPLNIVEIKLLALPELFIIGLLILLSIL